MEKPIIVNLGNLLLSLSDIIDIAKSNFAQHQHRTTFIAFEIAKKVFSDPDKIRDVFTAALLHDIGATPTGGQINASSPGFPQDNAHCIRGEMLLERVSWFKKSAEIVRNRHKPWEAWGEDKKEAVALSAQIIALADCVESLIDRNVYILHQNRALAEKAKEEVGGCISKEIYGAFVEVSRREEFWLNLVSQRLYPILLKNSPYRDFEIDVNGVLGISEFIQEIIDFKSPYTATHSTGVSACAQRMSQLYGLIPMDVKLMQIAGSFHDIGKLVIPKDILEKAGSLTAEEFAIIKSHSYFTYSALNTIGGLQKIVDWASFHHERLDGNGYPFHYKAEEMDFRSKIIAVADVFTALSENRPYRPGMAEHEIRAIMSEQAKNNALDGRVVALILDNYGDISGFVGEKQREAEEFYRKYSNP